MHLLVIMKEGKERRHGYWWLEAQINPVSKLLFNAAIGCSKNMPKPLKNWVLDFLEYCFTTLSRLINIGSVRSISPYQIEGIEKHSNKKLHLLIAADNETIKYVTKSIFNKILTEEKLGFYSLKNISNKIKNKDIDFDIALIKSDIFYNQFFKGCGFITMPEYVSFEMDITHPNEEMYSKDITYNLELLKNNDFTYEISSDREKIVLFYNQMYRPYITWRHGSTAKVATLESILYMFHRGAKLLLIKENDEYIFGGMFLIKKNHIKTYYAGFMEGKYDYLTRGVTALSYYYLIKFAKEHNMRSIDFGTARSFMNDGMFIYKLKWGMHIKKSAPEISQMFALKFNKNSIPVRNFLMNNPAVFFENKGLKAIIFKSSERKDKHIVDVDVNQLKNSMSHIDFITPMDFLE